MKKIVLFAAAGLLTTATIIAASVNTGKKTEREDVKKEMELLRIENETVTKILLLLILRKGKYTY